MTCWASIVPSLPTQNSLHWVLPEAAPVPLPRHSASQEAPTRSRQMVANKETITAS